MGENNNDDDEVLESVQSSEHWPFPSYKPLEVSLEEVSDNNHRLLLDAVDDDGDQLARLLKK